MMRSQRKGRRYLAGLVIAFAFLFLAIGTLGPARHSAYYWAIVPLPAAIAFLLGVARLVFERRKSIGYSAAALILLVAVLLLLASATEISRMIVGIGSDLCNIERIEQSLERWGDKFLNRVFTEVEQAKAASRPHTRAGTLAKRFAAKEAFSKAVGTGFRRGVFMKDIGVVNLPSGAPTLQLTGGAKARLDALAPEGHAIDIHLTMTDDYPWAQAFVILTARKLEP